MPEASRDLHPSTVDKGWAFNGSGLPPVPLSVSSACDISVSAPSRPRAIRIARSYL
jgi:hypothetical protein